MFKDIYIFNARALAERLNKNNIEDSQVLKNVLIFVVLFTYGYTLPINIEIQQIEEDSYGYFSGLFWLVTGVINYVGIKLLFKENEKGDGADFFKRLMALSLPVSILVTIIIFISMFFVGVLSYFLESLIINLTETHLNIIILTFLTIYMVTFYFLMRKYFIVASRREA